MAASNNQRATPSEYRWLSSLRTARGDLNETPDNRRPSVSDISLKASLPTGNEECTCISGVSRSCVHRQCLTRYMVDPRCVRWPSTFVDSIARGLYVGVSCRQYKKISPGHLQISSQLERVMSPCLTGDWLDYTGLAGRCVRVGDFRPPEDSRPLYILALTKRRPIRLRRNLMLSTRHLFQVRLPSGDLRASMAATSTITSSSNRNGFWVDNRRTGVFDSTWFLNRPTSSLLFLTDCSLLVALLRPRHQLSTFHRVWKSHSRSH